MNESSCAHAYYEKLITREIYNLYHKVSKSFFLTALIFLITAHPTVSMHNQIVSYYVYPYESYLEQVLIGR